MDIKMSGGIGQGSANGADVLYLRGPPSQLRKILEDETRFPTYPILVFAVSLL